MWKWKKRPSTHTSSGRSSFASPPSRSLPLEKQELRSSGCVARPLGVVSTCVRTMKEAVKDSRKDLRVSEMETNLDILPRMEEKVKRVR